MNTTPDPQYSNADPGAGAPTGGTGGGFFSWLRGLGIVRGDDRWLAGVAGGIAHRFRIDPLIVRGAFIVLALIGGSAILIYLIGWLLLPDKFGRIHLEEMFRGRAQAGVITAVVILAAILITPVVFGMGSPLGIGNLIMLSPFGLPGWLTATLTWLLWIAVIVGLGIWLPRLIKERRANSDAGATAPGASSYAGQQPAAGPAAGPAAPGSPTASAPSTAPSGVWTAPAAGAAGAPVFTAEKSATPTTPTVPLTPDPAPAGPAQGTAQSAGQGPDWATGHAPDPDPSRGASFATGSADSAGSSGPAAPPSDFASRADAWGRRTGEQASEWGREAGRRAEAWADEVGRKSEDWSARLTEEYESRNAGPVYTLVSLAAALLAAGGAAAIALASGLTGSELVLPGLIAGLATLALALIIAGIRGSHTGWVGFLASCGVIALVFTALLPSGSRFQPFGNVASNGAEPGVLALAGNLKLDLRDDALTSGSDAKHPFTATLAAGNLSVVLPQDRPAIVQVRVLAGGIKDEASGSGTLRTGGPLLERTVASGGANVAHPSSDTLFVAVYLAAGNVTVERSGPASIPRTTTSTQLQLDSETAR